MVDSMGCREYFMLLWENIDGKSFAPPAPAQATPVELAALLWQHERETLRYLDAWLNDNRIEQVCHARAIPLLWPFSLPETNHFRERIDRILLRSGLSVTTGISYYTREELHCFLLRSRKHVVLASGKEVELVSCDILTFDSKQQKLHLRFHQGEYWKRLSYPAAFGEIFFGDLGHFVIRRRYHLERAVACEDCKPAGHLLIKSVTMVAFSIMEYDGNATEVYISARKNANQILRKKFWPLSRNAVLKMLKFRVIFRDGAARTYCVYADRIVGAPYNDHTLCVEEFLAMTGVLEIPDAIDEF